MKYIRHNIYKLCNELEIQFQDNSSLAGHITQIPRHQQANFSVQSAQLMFYLQLVAQCPWRKEADRYAFLTNGWLENIPDRVACGTLAHISSGPLPLKHVSRQLKHLTYHGAWRYERAHAPFPTPR